MRYICDPHIIPSVVPADLSSIEAAVERAAYAHALHIDIADGRFAQNSTWPSSLGEIGGLRGITQRLARMAFTAHLMVQDPREIGLALIAAGVTNIVAHTESFAAPQAASQTLAAWRSAGAAEVGIALKIDTPLSVLEGIEGYDVVQLMSIDKIGQQGEPFDDRILSRVEEFHAEHPDTLVAIDGGVSEANIEALVRAGANRLVVGHVLSESDNPERVFSDMLERAMRGCAPIAAHAAV
jgi:ribulose-phosphate 3-epimerase